MKFEVKTTIRKVKHQDRFGTVGDRLQPVVEVWIDGIPCIHECSTVEESMALAVKLAYSLGLS